MGKRRTDAEMVEYLLNKAGKIMRKHDWILIAPSGAVVVNKLMNEYLDSKYHERTRKAQEKMIVSQSDIPCDGGDPW